MVNGDLATKNNRAKRSMTRLRDTHRTNIADRKDVGSDSRTPYSSRDMMSRNQLPKRPQIAAAYRAIRTRYQRTTGAKARVAAQHARQKSREPGRFPLFGGQTPAQRPL